MKPLCTPDIAVKALGPQGEAGVVRCKRWSCEVCREINRRRVIAFGKRGNPTAMLTLTVSSKAYETPDDAARDLKRALVALRKRIARAYPGEDPQSIKDPAAGGEYVADLMGEGFDRTALHALPKVMEKA